jgi:hypothetical protein
MLFKIKKRNVIILSLFLVYLSNAQAVMYKITEPDGTVRYSDVPATGSSKVDLPKLQPMSSGNYKKHTAPVNPKANNKAKEKTKPYQQFAIIYPKNGAAIRNNQGKVTLILNIKPALQTGHKIKAIINGKRLARSWKGQSVGIAGLVPGAYSIQVMIVDKKNKTVKSSGISLHFQRNIIHK